ncbi:MAG: PEP-CTERM sorting domain-containing protein [Phycisphaerae bacterium]|nr:PEP-CTERM sorting domain-containing protein [Phycisphaerae bacterium]
MKKLSVFLMLVLLMVSRGYSGVVWENDCSSMDGWSSGSGNGIGVYLSGGTIQMNSWANNGSNAGWTNLWRGTDVTIEADTEYDLIVNMKSFANEAPVTLKIQSIIDGTWATIKEESINPLADSFNDYTLSISTVNDLNSEHIGGTLAIGIAPGWWNNLGIDHVSIVPEPASLLILGLGVIGQLRRRQR